MISAALKDGGVSGGAGLTQDTCARILCSVNLTLSVDDEVVRKARRQAERLGSSLNQLVRDYLEQLAGRSDPERDAEEFERLSRQARGDSRGWKFDRDEIHERR